MATGRLRLGRAHGPAVPVCHSEPWVGFKVVVCPLPPAPRTPAAARMLHSCASVAETVDGLVEFFQPCGSFIDLPCPPLQRRPGELLPFLHKKLPQQG